VNFKKWYAEWEGTTFPGVAKQGDFGPQSKYNGHGDSYGERPEMIGNRNKVDKLYGFDKRMFKRMKKQG
jgi:hypothetical protein